MRNITAFFAGLLSIVLIAKAMSAEPQHLPPEVPTSATGFICSNDGKSGLIVAIVFSYANGSVYRFDGGHMFGMTPRQAAQWADQAADTRVYAVPCVQPPVT
jgi:hypothetical protein